MELNEGLRKIFLAGVGAVATTAETAKDVVDNLVKKGEITVEQGKVLNEELKQSAKEKMKEHVTVTVIKEYKDAMSAVDHMKADELEALKAKIAEAEKAAAERAAAENNAQAAEESGTAKEDEAEAPESCEAAEDTSEAAPCPSEETPDAADPKASDDTPTQDAQ